MDRPILAAREYIEQMSQTYNIVYLSGRRQTTLYDTKEWLEVHRFAYGYVSHRPSGHDSKQFKLDVLIELNKATNVIAYFGDRFVDDCCVAIEANVRPVLVFPNQWIFYNYTLYGIESVYQDRLESPVLKDKT